MVLFGKIKLKSSLCCMNIYSLLLYNNNDNNNNEQVLHCFCWVFCWPYAVAHHLQQMQLQPQPLMTRSWVMLELSPRTNEEDRERLSSLRKPLVSISSIGFLLLLFCSYNRLTNFYDHAISGCICEKQCFLHGHFGQSYIPKDMVQSTRIVWFCL